MDLSKVIETVTIETVSDVINYTVELKDEKRRTVNVYRSEQSDGFKPKRIDTTTNTHTDDSAMHDLAKDIIRQLKAHMGPVVSVSYNLGNGYETYTADEDGYYLREWAHLPLYVKGWLAKGNHPDNVRRLVKEAYEKECK